MKIRILKKVFMGYPFLAASRPMNVFSAADDDDEEEEEQKKKDAAAQKAQAGGSASHDHDRLISHCTQLLET